MQRFMDRSQQLKSFIIMGTICFSYRNRKIILCASFMEHASHKIDTNYRTNVQDTIS